jgi:flagellin-like protein
MKGISPLLAAVLLIAVTVSIGTLVMGWLGTTVRSSQASVSNVTSVAVNCASANIVIDDVYVYTGARTATVIVRNSGRADDMQLTSAFIVNATGNSVSPAESLPVTDFDKGEIQTFTYSSTGINACANFSQAIVTTNCGGVSAKFDKTPICS